MNTVIKTHVPMGQLDKLIDDMEATGFDLDVIREHQMGGVWWLLFRRPALACKDDDDDEPVLALAGEAAQALRNAQVPPHASGFDPTSDGVFVK